MVEDSGLDAGSRNASKLDAAFAAWRADADLAAVLDDARGVFLVLAADGAQVLRASERGRALLAAAGRDGALDAALAEQVRRAGSGPGARLLRLRLAARGLAAPALCRVAPWRDADGVAYLLAVQGPLPGLDRAPRPAPGRPAAPPAADPAPAEPPAPAPGPEVTPPAGARFLWRTDAEGVLARGPEGDVLARIAGQSWEALARSGRIGGETAALLAALAEHRTFRGIALDLARAPEPALAFDLSGAPSGRAGQPFAGFNGFGIVRPPREAAAPETASRPAPAPQEAERPPVPCGVGIPADPIALASMAAPFFAAWLGQSWFGGERPAPEPSEAPPRGPELAPVPDPVPETAAPAPSAPEPEPGLQPAVPAEEPGSVEEPHPADGSPTAEEAALSLTEHAAFREIARALGARYAGDEEAAPEAPATGGSVTPFPGGRPSAEPDPDAILEGIPGAVLVHREGAVLAANGLLLALAAYPDLDALRGAGLDRLFRGLSPDRHPEGGEAFVTVAIETADGRFRPVTLSRSRMLWGGAPAECLLLRPVAADDPHSQRVADELASSFRAARGADALAALDILDDGVAILDGAGRVLALNRAAATLFACAPREVVGGAFPALFPMESVAVQAVLDGAAPEASVTVSGRSAVLRAARLGEDRRAALLRLAAREPGAGPLGAGFLGTLDRGIRTPLTGILGFADVMLKEPEGPLGHPRYGTYLRDIRSSGEQVLALVTDLIDLATVEAGGLALVPEPILLNDLVAAAVAQMQGEASHARILLRTSFAENLPPLEADAASLARAVALVIANALRQSGPGGQVIVSTVPGERGGAALRVRNTGAGLTPEAIAFALDPFGGDAGARPEIGGGLGLPLMRALVEANGGSLRISSRKDEGALVEIVLPARAARRAQA